MIYLPLLVIVALAATTAIVIRQVVRGSAQQMSGATDLEGRTKAVDVLAFRNLMDMDQDEFLRKSLAAREYRRLKRTRNRVAVSYVKTVYENSATLIRLGEVLQKQPATAEEGTRILDLAIKNRVSAALLLVKLRFGRFYPGVLTTEALARDYSHLKENVSGILRRATPLKSSRILVEL